MKMSFQKFPLFPHDYLQPLRKKSSLQEYLVSDDLKLSGSESCLCVNEARGS